MLPLQRRHLSWILIALGLALVAVPPAALTVTDWLQRRAQREVTEQWVRKHLASPPPRQEASKKEVVHALDPGDGGYLLEIPKLGLRTVVHELEPEVFSGRNTPRLKRYGLGQVPHTSSLRNVNPGEIGTAAITGHRTTSGAPFRDIHRLGPGDSIILSRGAIQQRWSVTYSTSVVPNQVDAIRSRNGVRRLAILACTPPFSARERLIVYAKLTEEGGN